MARRMHLVAEGRGESKERAKVVKEWDAVHHVVVQRFRGGSVTKSVSGLTLEKGDVLDGVLEQAQQICDEDAAEVGPGHYIASFRAEDDRVIGPIGLTGGNMPDEGSLESETVRTVRAVANANTAMAKAMEIAANAFGKRETDITTMVGTLVDTVGKLMVSSATGTAATADATVRIAQLQFLSDESRHERADERAKAEAEAKNMTEALQIGSRIATPLVGIYSEHLKEELAEKREEKKREKAKKRAAEQARAAAEEAATAAAAPKKKRSKKKAGAPAAEPKSRMRKPRAARAKPSEEAAPEQDRPPKPAPERRPSAGIVADAAAFLESIDDDGTETGEWQRLAEIVGTDLWDCLIAVAKAPSDDAARAIMAKAVDIVDGPLIPGGGGEREEARAMPADERKRIERDLAGLLGWTRGIALQHLLAKGGVIL